METIIPESIITALSNPEKQIASFSLGSKEGQWQAQLHTNYDFIISGESADTPNDAIKSLVRYISPSKTPINPGRIL